MSVTGTVINFAKDNGGVITTHEALALGMPQSTLDRRVADGVLVRINRGVLALPGTATRPDILLRAAARKLGAVVSHQSAGRLHGLGPIPRTPPTVMVSHRGTYRFPGLIVHQVTDLHDGHVVEMDGMPVTSVPRTIIDLAKVTKAGRLERIVDNALTGAVTLDDLRNMYGSLSRRGKKGMPVLGRILEERLGQPALSETELERRLRQLLVNAGLPEPVRQFHAPWLARSNGRVDLAYPEFRIVIEADSRRWHTLTDAFETDRWRDNAAQLAGWVVLRITWRMITDEPVSVVSLVRRAIENANQVPSRGT